jgi:FkbM family methyltransferase
VRLPPELCGSDWDAYEPEVFQELCELLDRDPDTLVLDIGCAVGIFSVGALFRSSRSAVIAIDPDLASLRATQRLTVYAPGHRLTLIHGFVSDEDASDDRLDKVARRTNELLAQSKLTGDPGTTAYQALETRDPSMPVYGLDHLFSDHAIAPGRPVLLKCDVEGAELRVLRSGRELLSQYRPTLLLSVHPLALPVHGHTVADVRDFLAEHRYDIAVIAIDHEEHWLCQPQYSASAP